MRVLYGGAVKPDNAAELLALPDIDGGARRRRVARGRVVRRDRRGRAAHELPGAASASSSSTAGAWPRPGPGNAVELADTPVFDELWARYPHTTLTACGQAVGLPEGQMGNSEVGHLNLGAGAVVKQDLVRIDEASRRFAEQRGARRGDATAPSACTSSGSSPTAACTRSLEHLSALVALARERGRRRRRRPRLHRRPRHLAHERRRLPRAGRRLGGRRVGTVVGRYYAMDRDNRAERTERRVDLLVDGEAEHHARRGEEAVRAAYERDETDEFIAATDGRRRGADPAGGQRARLQLPPRPDAPDRHRARPRRSTRHHDADRVRGGLAYPVVFPPARPAVTLASVIAGARRRPAPRRRDREVPARDVLLQRRRGGAVRRRAARARAVAARRPDLRPQARDERARGGRRVRRALGRGRAARSRSSTSPTPTWSATPARSPPRSRPCETVDACLADVVARGRRSAAASASSPPTTATPTRCSRPTARRTPRTR